MNAWNGGNLSMSLLKSERWFPCGIFAHKTLETGLIFNADLPLFHDIIFLMNPICFSKQCRCYVDGNKKNATFYALGSWNTLTEITVTVLIWQTYFKRHVHLYHVSYTQSSNKPHTNENYVNITMFFLVILSLSLYLWLRIASLCAVCPV